MIIDLSLSINPETKIFPGSPHVAFLKWAKLDIEGYDLETMFLSTHTGTHIDAPSHFIKEGDPVDKIDVNRFFMKSTHLFKIQKQSNELITVNDIEKIGIFINEGDSILFSTGWENQIDSKSYVTENPGLSREAAIYLSNKKINAVGIDGPSIDVGNDSKFTAHEILLTNNIIIIENLCGLNKIDKQNFILIACPLKLSGSTGSPVRALAII